MYCLKRGKPNEKRITVIGGRTYNFAGGNAVGTLSIGDSGAERTITNVAAGRVSATSTDAVNG
ncbi:MAG: hypothetical protein E7C62_10670, partial [Veillonella sp.]|nr:hypothetical protein [Veillonella sp.]